MLALLSSPFAFVVCLIGSRRAQIVHINTSLEPKRPPRSEVDVLTFPTYHREGLRYALLEAMAAGVVPVISPIGAIADVVQDEVQTEFSCQLTSRMR